MILLAQVLFTQKCPGMNAGLAKELSIPILAKELSIQNTTQEKTDAFQFITVFKRLLPLLCSDGQLGRKLLLFLYFKMKFLLYAETIFNKR